MPFFSQSPLEAIRKAQYAGSWYESDAAVLREQLNGFLERAKSGLATAAPYSVSDQEAPLAIIAPHAGYMFSGATAAFSYQCARSPKIKRVFLLGPSHHAAVQGVALPAAEIFETPLGNLPVDTQTILQLKSYPLFSVRPDVHRVEHSLEMQLPLIRQTFGEIKIVPLIIGLLQDEAEIRLVAETLKNYVGRDDLVVVSSDFTHFGPRYGYTPFHNDVRENVEKLDREAFHCLSRCELGSFIEFYRRTEDTICGLFPCAVLCALLPEGAHGSLLRYATSQDTATEDKDNSVSYLAIAFHGKQWPETPAKYTSQAIDLSRAEKQTLLKIARQSLELYVRERQTFNPQAQGDIELTAALRRPRGAFVTLYKTGSGSYGGRLVHEDKELRGCIGTIWPVRPLYEAVVENAIASSTRDYRFGAVTEAELAQIRLEISVLTPPQRVPSYRDIVLGSDGIVLSKHDRQAVFLPFVATEFGWDLKQTLQQLSLKAGLHENDWQTGAQFDLFQSISIAEEH